MYTLCETPALLCDMSDVHMRLRSHVYNRYSSVIGAETIDEQSKNMKPDQHATTLCGSVTTLPFVDLNYRKHSMRVRFDNAKKWAVKWVRHAYAQACASANAHGQAAERERRDAGSPDARVLRTADDAVRGDKSAEETQTTLILSTVQPIYSRSSFNRPGKNRPGFHASWELQFRWTVWLHRASTA